MGHYGTHSVNPSGTLAVLCQQVQEAGNTAWQNAICHMYNYIQVREQACVNSFKDNIQCLCGVEVVLIHFLFWNQCIH